MKGLCLPKVADMYSERSDSMARSAFLEETTLRAFLQDAFPRVLSEI